MKRSTIREHVFRILFRYDFYGQEDFAEQATLYFDARVPEKIVPIMYRKGPVEKDEDDDELDCAVISDMDRAEIQSRAEQIAALVPEIDKQIEAACDGWALGRIGKAELAILRVAVFELKYDGIKPAIAINEAVELAKKYCDVKSRSFVNGVLAKML